MSKIQKKEMKQRLSRVDKFAKKRTPWECVKLSRNINRPGVEDYIKLICDDFIPLCGDRLYGDDKAMLGGIGDRKSVV